MNFRDEQTTNTTPPEEPIPRMTSTSPPEDEVQGEVGFTPHASMTPINSVYSVNGYEEPDGYVPPWEEYQEAYDRRRVTVRSAVFGGLSGAIFFFGLVVAILSGHFWPVFLVALAIGSLVGSLSSSKAQVIYGGFQGFVFFLVLGVCSAFDWWGPGILVVLGIAAILGIGNGLLATWRQGEVVVAWKEADDLDDHPPPLYFYKTFSGTSLHRCNHKYCLIPPAAKMNLCDHGKERRAADSSLLEV
jgi:hypothetical protein